MTRIKDAEWAANWSDKLRKALPSAAEGDSSAAKERLAAAWETAARPSRRSLTRDVLGSVRAIHEALRQPLVLPAESADGGGEDGDSSRVQREGGSADSDPFAPFSGPDQWAEWDRAFAAHVGAGLPMSSAPLTPEQRAAGRNFLRQAVLRSAGRKRGDTPAQIDALVKAEGLPPVTLTMGAGGTGKSALVHALKREFERLGLGKLLVTAFTGVAAAPFAGPTLLRALNMSPRIKGTARVRQASETLREKTRAKFREECGAPIEEFGGVIVDEVSFIEIGLFGHADMAFRTLLGPEASDVVLGGMPLMLAGDNHQKPPPGGTPWYRVLVEQAVGEGENLLARAGDDAQKMGLLLLKSARLVLLRKLMRARTDEKFIRHQQQMRETGSTQPVSDEFLRALRPVSAADLAEDPSWQFAPIGILSHVERDTINLAQLHAFARKFNLPVVRWRLELVDDVFKTEAERELLYANEPNLWGYFVEGVPVLLTETIKSTRKLVNGSPGLLDSVEARTEADQRVLAAAYAHGYDEAMATLDAPPRSVNVIVGGTAASPRLWHGIPLDDLTGLVPETGAGSNVQVVPICPSTNPETVQCLSMYAAQQGIAQRLQVSAAYAAFHLSLGIIF